MSLQPQLPSPLPTWPTLYHPLLLFTASAAYSVCALAAGDGVATAEAGGRPAGSLALPTKHYSKLCAAVSSLGVKWRLPCAQLSSP